LHELAHAAGVGLWVDAEAIPILPECKALCAEFNLNPLGLIASGALLVALAHEETPALLSLYREAKTACSRIGRITPASEGLKLRSGASTIDLPRFDQDEVARLL
jgi:hydrogenase maturation factor